MSVNCILLFLLCLGVRATLLAENAPSDHHALEQAICVSQEALLHGKLDQARDELTQALDLARSVDPPDPGTVVQCLVLRAQLAFGRGDWDGAEKDDLEAGTVLSHDVSVLEHLGELRAAQRRFPEAIELYREAIAQAERPDLLQALGDVYEFSGDTTNARALHARALAGYLKSAGEGSTAYFRLLSGFYADVQPEPAEALRWARKAVESDRNASTCDALAWALYKNGQWTEAADAAGEALAQGTRDAHLFYHAGLIFSRAGNLARGGKLLREVSVVNPRYFNTFHAHR